jgi:hypothetical protein
LYQLLFCCREPLHFGDFSLSLQSLKEMQGAKERVVNITWAKAGFNHMLSSVANSFPDFPAS